MGGINKRLDIAEAKKLKNPKTGSQLKMKQLEMENFF